MGTVFFTKSARIYGYMVFTAGRISLDVKFGCVSKSRLRQKDLKKTVRSSQTETGRDVTDGFADNS